jgi:hypothetical protein
MKVPGCCSSLSVHAHPVRAWRHVDDWMITGAPESGHHLAWNSCQIFGCGAPDKCCLCCLRGTTTSALHSGRPATCLKLSSTSQRSVDQLCAKGPRSTGCVSSQPHAQFSAVCCPLVAGSGACAQQRGQHQRRDLARGRFLRQKQPLGLSLPQSPVQVQDVREGQHRLTLAYVQIVSLQFGLPLKGRWYPSTSASLCRQRSFG